MQIHKSLLILIIILSCFLSYFNTLSADFVWDDNVFIVANPYMKSFEFLPHFFTQDFWSVGVQKVNAGYYRPLLAASFMLNYIFGNGPFGFHLANLIYHMLASILVFLFCFLLLKNKFISFIAAMVFATHPLHTEAVSFISGRVDVLTLVFYLLSLVLFLKYISNNKLIIYLLSLISFLAALLTKEMAVTLPFIIICIDYMFFSQGKIKSVFRNFFRIHLGFFITFAVYMLLRMYALGTFFAPKASVDMASNFLPGQGLFWRVFTVIKIIFIYIRLLFFPYGLKAEYFFNPANSFFEPIVLIGLGVLVFFIVLAVKNLKNKPVSSFSIAWFFLTILPVSNIIPQGNIFAERYMYIPSVGFCIGIGYVFFWLLKKNVKTNYLNWRSTIYILITFLIIALGRVTFERNKVWNNEVTFWVETAHAEKASARAHRNLAGIYYKKNLLEEAEKEIQKALKIYPSYDSAFILLGHIYSKRGMNDLAIDIYDKVINIAPENPEAYSSLAVAYGRLGKYKKAIEAGLSALEKNPYLDEAKFNLAVNYRKFGLTDKAIESYQDYLKTNDNYIAHFDLGYLYYKKGQYKKARSHWLKTLELSPDYKPAKDALKLLKDL